MSLTKRWALVAGAVAVMASGVMAQKEMCLYSSGDCWPRSGDPGCDAHGWVFSGGEEGEGTLCAGGTFTGEGKDQNPPTSQGASLGCCRWAENNPSGNCWDVFTSGEATDCDGGDNTFWASACPDKQGTCPGGTTDPCAGSGAGSSACCDAKPNHSSCGGTGDGRGPCSDPSIGGGKNLFCEYTSGCYEIQNQYPDDSNDGTCAANPTAQGCEDCSIKISNCTGTLYTDVDKTASGMGSPTYGSGVKCANVGGNRVTGDNVRGPCVDQSISSEPLFCEYTTGCYEIQNAYSDGGVQCTTDPSAEGCEPCADQIAHCKNNYGTLYAGVNKNSSGWVDDGDGVECANVGGFTVSVLESARTTPDAKVDMGAAVVVPTRTLSGEFTAGPSPVSKDATFVKFYRQGSVLSGTLTIYSSSGRSVAKVKIADSAVGDQGRREVGAWNMKDKKGRAVAGGTYLVKGTLKAADGSKEKVSFKFAIAK